MSTLVNDNERSWVIQIISEINAFADRNDLCIKRAGGENTVSTKSSSLFPDLILYADKERTRILQGWEAKMPDTPIDDLKLFENAKKKASALALNSFILWNFKYVSLYIKPNEYEDFAEVKRWEGCSHIRTRDDVKTYQNEWQNLLLEVLTTVDVFLESGKIGKAATFNSYSESMLNALVDRNYILVAEEFEKKARRNGKIEAHVQGWWLDVRNEYLANKADKGKNDRKLAYRAYSKTVLLNWALRIMFAHTIKTVQRAAREIDHFTSKTTPEEANKIFQHITQKCDFYNAFTPIKYNEIIPETVWSDIVDYWLFFKNFPFDVVDAALLQKAMEGSISSSKREINGQFSTPRTLARLLVRLSVIDWHSEVLDCCCGTGTIPRAAIEEKIDRGVPVKQAVETVWASDKYNFPLQIANIGLLRADSVRIANRLFQHDAMDIRTGQEIVLVDPETAKSVSVKLPEFDVIVSNLPFVAQELLPEKYKDWLRGRAPKLSGRSDLYCIISLKLKELLRKNGRVGIITSNAWLGTSSGKLWISHILKDFCILQVHISGKGRWFEDEEVVTTMLVLKLRNGDSYVSDTSFCMWMKSLAEIDADSQLEQIIVSDSLKQKQMHPNVVTIRNYSEEIMERYSNLNVSYNALFYDIEWLSDFERCVIPIKKAFSTMRGSRGGCNDFFYPTGNHAIESRFLIPLLKNLKGVGRSISSTPLQYAFCCNLSVKELKAMGYKGALMWIEKFANLQNDEGIPLRERLAKTSSSFWYTLAEQHYPEICTLMNPEKRFFFTRTDGRYFVDQRIIGLCHTSKYADIELNHALLNSVFSKFAIEASGFGKGLGALDTNKEKIACINFLNPSLISSCDRRSIIHAFEKIVNQPVKDVEDELKDPQIEIFDRVVLKAYGLEHHYETICSTLAAMQRARLSVKKKH